MSKWKFFNFRPLFFVFTILVVSILSVNYVRSKIYLTIAFLFITLLLVLVYCILHKRVMYFVIAIITICVGFSGFYLKKKDVESTHIDFAGKSVYGVVENVTKTVYGREFVIKDVKLNGKRVNTKCSVRLIKNEVLEDFNLGDKVVFVVEDAEELDLFGTEIPNAGNIRNNIKYSLTTKEVVHSGSNKTLKDKLQLKIKDNLMKGLDNDKANLMYSSLFGDKSELNSMTKDSFSISGVAHLLAVSGLHVGLIVAILNVILKICKCNKYAKLAIIFAFLIFYCYLCGWSASIVRATIMSIVLLGAPLIFSEYDTLSAISFAGIILLVINPVSLFDISFLLSFMCVFGISMLYPYFTKLLNKIHFNNPMTQILSISIITNFATLFIMLYAFKEINIVGVISNIFILPLFTFVFSCVFVISLLSLIAPFVANLLVMIAPILNLVTLLSRYFASISFTIVSVELSFLSIITYFILLLFISKFNVKRFSGKVMCANVFLALLIIQIILNSKVIGL